MVAVLAVSAAACGSSAGSAATTVATSAAPDTSAPTTTVATTEATGPDSSTKEGKAFVSALMAQPNQDDAFTNTERLCISNAVVDAVGLKALDAAGITPEVVTGNTLDTFFPNFPITSDVADQILDSMYKCADMGTFFLKAATVNGTQELPDDKAKCFADALGTSPETRDVLKVTIMGDDSTAAQTKLQDAILPMVVACKITVDELTKAFGS